MAPRRQTPGQRTSATAWASWVNAALARRGWQQSDLIRAVGTDTDGKPVLSTSRVSQWCSGEQKASPDKAVAVAQALGENIGEALNAIGETKLAQAFRGAAPQPEAAAPPQGAFDPFLARLRASADPEMHKLADVYERDVSRVRRLVELELLELERKRQGLPAEKDGT
ncbi:helix-turn-helix transcriptional regulator [Actinocrinis puniceicyclus]|uniref:Helix-turn-helix transcriptional regulator n=1 Tax=Actinocrinis puniceicyclus TaxID=977794 RepID=A0A8J7WSB4_9ACTN|nr:helix-turn-helix transcriptional regulator [Actinocrinis puniceicyclus]MBS2965547.1 helix-turn-helix transcriptional regulator [Actinocrinis puniceicyclus]